jgi:hypothetical protein
MTWKLPNRIVPDEWIYIMFISRKWKEYTVVAAVHHQHFALNAHNKVPFGCWNEETVLMVSKSKRKSWILLYLGFVFFAFSSFQVTSTYGSILALSPNLC